MTTKAFFVSLPLPSRMGSISIHDSNGNGKMGIMATGGGVHTVMATENKTDFNLPLPSLCERAFRTDTA